MLNVPSIPPGAELLSDTEIVEAVATRRTAQMWWTDFFLISPLMALMGGLICAVNPAALQPGLVLVFASVVSPLVAYIVGRDLHATLKPDVLTTLLAHRQWDAPQVMQMVKMARPAWSVCAPDALVPLTEEEIVALNSTVEASDHPAAASLWDSWIRDPRVIRRQNAAHIQHILDQHAAALAHTAHLSAPAHEQEAAKARILDTKSAPGLISLTLPDLALKELDETLEVASQSATPDRVMR